MEIVGVWLPENANPALRRFLEQVTLAVERTRDLKSSLLWSRTSLRRQSRPKSPIRADETLEHRRNQPLHGDGPKTRGIDFSVVAQISIKRSGQLDRAGHRFVVGIGPRRSFAMDHLW